VNLVVDTSVWSLLLRREKHDPENDYLIQLKMHLRREDCIFIIGNILQELLDGIKNHKSFELTVEYLKPFHMIEISRTDYIDASRLKNHCRSRGINAGSVDFLIASVCINNHCPLLTADKDFEHIARHSKLMLVKSNQFNV